MNNELKLGRWHLWWLKKFVECKHQGMFVMGYEGTAQGKALGTLIKNGFIEFGGSFENGGASLTITEQGKLAYETNRQTG